MTSLLHQLENNEAILLMYVADELSAEDRAEVEQMLGSDAGMRAELEQIRAVREAAIGAMGSADEATRLPVSENVAVRRVMRMMRQWQIDHAHAPPPEEPVKELRFPWWSYPLSTAAAVLIAFLVWWGNRPEPAPRRQVTFQQEAPAGPSDINGMQQEIAGQMLLDSFDTIDEDMDRMTTNQPVDALVERLKATSAMKEYDLDAVFLN
jgi:hypothetical protein